MNVQFDWQAGEENGAWETIAAGTGHTRRKVSWRVWSLLIAALIALTAGGYALLLRRYHTALSRVAFQIQGVIDLEARALARRDTDLYLAQQDAASPAWLAGQAAHIRADEPQSDPGSPGACVWATVPRDRSFVKVQEVELWEDIAWVQVITGQEPVRQVRFYRRTDLGWKHTAPRIAFWGEPVELDYGNVKIRGHERDLPYIEPLAKHVTSVLNDVCATLECPSNRALRVNFAVQMGTDGRPALSGDTLTLPSPWLCGIPLAGTWDGAALAELTYWATYAAALQATRSAADQGLNPLQKAILVEYATFSSQGATQAPLLRRIIERHGVDSLPQVLHSVHGTRSLSQFVAQWLFPFPADENAHADTLADIAREAVSLGRVETVALVNLLPLENAAPWVEWTEYRGIELCYRRRMPDAYAQIQSIADALPCDF